MTISRKANENLLAVYYEATAEFRRIGREDIPNALCDDIGHELIGIDAWYDNECPEDETPDWTPTMADLNAELRKYGYKGIGGKNPRVVKL